MDGSIPIILLLIFIVIFIMLIIAYKFSSAIQNLNDNELDEIAQSNEKLYFKIAKVIENPSRFVITIQAITILEMFIAGFYICYTHTSYSKTICYAILFIVAELVFGIMLPKRLGLRKPKRYSMIYVRIISFMIVVFSPVTLIVSVLLHHFLAIDTSNGSFFYFSFFNQAPAYLVGMSMALGNQIGNGSIGFRIIRAGTLVLVILALFYFEFSFSYAVIPLLAALMFADVYTFLSSLPTLIRKTKWLCRIGQNTFAIYLSHFLVAWYIPIIIEKYLHITGVVLWMIVLCLCAVLCVLSPYISLPMTKLTKWFEKTITKR